jgi:hypothetical protein
VFKHEIRHSGSDGDSIGNGHDRDSAAVQQAAVAGACGRGRGDEHPAHAHAGSQLAANVELYTAVLLDVIGLLRQQFVPPFAARRIAGWSAHVIEQPGNDTVG